MESNKYTIPRWMRPLEPPECPPGWATGPPDFVGVGAQRSGTSWWYWALEQHPQVASPDEEEFKELHYFGRFWDGQVPDDLVERYHRFFPRPAGSIAGEWTPRYMYDSWTLRLLREAAPDARVLVMLRDPIERYRSGVARHLRRSDKAGGEINLMMFADAMARGLYHLQLRQVFDFFARDQVLVLQYERCVQDTRDQLDATCAFLGIEPFDELPQRATTRKRPPNPKPDLSDAMRADLVARLEDDVDRLGRLCPEIDLSLWPNFRHLGADRRAQPSAEPATP